MHLGGASNLGWEGEKKSVEEVTGLRRIGAMKKDFILSFSQSKFRPMRTWSTTAKRGIDCAKRTRTVE